MGYLVLVSRSVEKRRRQNAVERSRRLGGKSPIIAHVCLPNYTGVLLNLDTRGFLSRISKTDSTETGNHANSVAPMVNVALSTPANTDNSFLRTVFFFRWESSFFFKLKPLNTDTRSRGKRTSFFLSNYKFVIERLTNTSVNFALQYVLNL